MPTIDQAAARVLVARAPVGRLGTVTANGRPHLVPCCFAVVGDTIVSVVDGKPKSTGQLRRLENIEARPAASLLVDHYDDDWRELWWVRVDGRARVMRPDDAWARAEVEAAIDALADKYRQYREQRPSGALVVIDIEQVTGWSFSDRSEPPSAAANAG